MKQQTPDVTKGRVVEFQVPGQPPVAIRIKNENASLRSILPKIASRLNVAGTFDPCDQTGQRLNLSAPISDLPDRTLLPAQLTPAS